MTLLLAAILTGGPALAAPWPCPLKTCAWAPDTRFVPLAPDTATILREGEPFVLPVPAGAKVAAVVTMPVRGDPAGPTAWITWDGTEDLGRVELVGGRQVQSALQPTGYDNVVPVGLGVAKDAKGAGRPVSAALFAVSVPEGATALRLVTAGKREIAVLGSGTWAEGPPFPFTPDRVVPDGAWVPFLIPEDGTLELPRPAALGPVAPVAGFLRPEGGRLVDEKGETVRLYGTNLVIGWDIPNAEDAEKLARTLSTLGFNLVRLSILPVSRATLYAGGAARKPTAEEWARFDTLIDALARHGVRVQFPLVEADHGWGNNSLAAQVDRKGEPDLWPFFDDKAREAQKAHMRAMLTRKSTVRGVPLANDPVLAIVEVSNETGALRAWMSGSWEQLGTAQRATLVGRWNAWLRAKYPDEAALIKAWSGSANPGLAPGESLVEGTVAVEPELHWRWGTWPEARRRDLALFHQELDRAYFADMRGFLQNTLKIRALVVGTQHMSVVSSSLLHAQNPLGDAHFQYDHPGGAPMEQGRQPLTSQPVERSFRILLTNAVLGQPYHVGEYNYGWPSPYEYEAPLLFGTVAARQGWSGMNWFVWRHANWDPAGPGKIEGQMDVSQNPVKVGQLPVAAAILRGALVPEADGLVVHQYGDAGVTGPSFPMQPPWMGPGDGQFLVDHRIRSSFDTTAPNAAAPTPGPVTWGDDATFVVDAPGVSAVLSSGPRKETRWLAVGGAPGSASVVGLDAVPLADANRWLLAVGSRALNTGHREIGAWTIASLGEGPVRLAPYGGTIELRGQGRGTPTVTRLGPDGKPAGVVSVKRSRSGYVLDLAALPPSPWYVVEWPTERRGR